MSSYPAFARRPVAESLEPRTLMHAGHAHTAWYVNAGGGDFNATTGQSFQADAQFAGGTGSSGNIAIAQTVNDPLYASRRWGKNFSYNLPVENGNYALKLYFAEVYFTANGKRAFDVSAEGKQLLNDYDIHAQVGANAAAVKSFAVTVADGALNVSFAGVVDNAIVSAIEAVRTSAAPAPNPTPSTAVAWATKANAPARLAEASAASVGGKLYVLGGYDTTSPKWTATARVDRYDPLTNAWQARAPMPERMTHTGVASDDRYVYVAGGYVTLASGNQLFANAKVYRYDTVSNAWSTLPALPQARGAGAAAIVGRSLHFFGGVSTDRRDKADHWSLNLDNPAAGWQARAVLPAFKNHLGAATLNGKIYAVGGQIGENDSTNNQSSVYAYDPAQDRWSAVASLPKARGHIGGSTFAHAGRLVVAGGISTGGATLSDVTAYDPATGRWTAMTNLPATRHSAAAGSVGGKFVVTTGYLNGLQQQTWVGTVG